jgi:hypothetical protein
MLQEFCQSRAPRRGAAGDLTLHRIPPLPILLHANAGVGHALGAEDRQ